ncbi:GTP-binding protein REM 1 isoform X1 [Zootoca vivipara]|uniref:GTP-binding protein REM 1 isoform X1 n=1 Tax=Zootoca vivipara TaxID=8524 RepID=UPI00293B8D40|nr:GTP-binding protein REM 1 isoform X1 [Zootoca vivipara]
MTLNTQRGGSTTPARRRASTPLPMPYGSPPGMLSVRRSHAEPSHPQLGQSSSCDPKVHLPEPPGSWSPESSDSEESWESLYRVVLLGDPGVGKTSLMYLFAGVQDKDLPEQQREDTYERTLSVDGEETTLMVIDTWEAEKRAPEEDNWFHNYCMQVGNAYVIVYSITDRGSFESASELRIQLRRTRQAENIPIILVGNKTDLRAVPAPWSSTASSLRHPLPCSTTCPSSSRGWCGRSAYAATARRPTRSACLSTSARRASPRRCAASSTGWWLATTRRWR